MSVFDQTHRAIGCNGMAGCAIHEPVPTSRAVALTRDEWLTLRTWMDEHGYNAQRDEPIDAWQRRSGPVAYAYALIVQAACDHRPERTEPYCARCGMLMEV